MAICTNCQRDTNNDRLRAGRCMSCYRYWRKHGNDRPTERQPGGSFVHFAEVIVPVVESAIRDAEGPETITVYDLPAYNVCGVGFTTAEWEDRHEGHEPGCPRRYDSDSDVVCDCDLVYHAHCCPDCADEGDE